MKELARRLLHSRTNRKITQPPIEKPRGAAMYQAPLQRSPWPYVVFKIAMRANVGVDAAARIKAPSAAPSKLRNTLPPLASNDLLDFAVSNNASLQRVFSRDKTKCQSRSRAGDNRQNKFTRRRLAER